jgi:hypothetical protein
MASAITRDTDTISSLSNSFSGGMGTVLVTTTRLMTEFLRRSTAGSESTPWVATAQTSDAPAWATRSAAWQIVPPVSISSSTITHIRPSTSPRTPRVVTPPVSGSRRLSTTAVPALRWVANFSITLVRPVSGETITRSRGAWVRK